MTPSPEMEAIIQSAVDKANAKAVIYFDNHQLDKRGNSHFFDAMPWSDQSNQISLQFINPNLLDPTHMEEMRRIAQEAVVEALSTNHALLGKVIYDYAKQGKSIFGVL